MVHKLIGLFVGFLMLCSYFSGSVLASYSEWAEETVLFAKECGLISEDWDFRQPMSRGEAVSVLLGAYQNVTKKEIPKGDVLYFTDAGEEATSLALLGVMNGVGDGLFSPDTPITREQISKIILTLKATCNDTEVLLPPAYYNPLKDFMSVSDWAKPYVEQAYNEGIVTGYDDGNFYGQKSVSREEVLTLLVRSLELTIPVIDQPIAEEEPKPDEKPAFLGDHLQWNLEDEYSSGALTLYWNSVPGIETYTLEITEQRNSRYEGDIPPNQQTYTYIAETSHTLYLYPHRTYTFRLTAGKEVLEAERYIPKMATAEMEPIRANLPATQEEADSLMETVTVPVWKLKSDGTKTTATMEVVVHREIADIVTCVFQEIYEGKEQFPIKDMGGYAFRGGKTEHNWGTAIDLNYNENYCLYKDGTAVGECWSPGENPYSLTPYGDVVNAFEKYGFTWGGDAWSNPKDYMHFSYLGT